MYEATSCSSPLRMPKKCQIWTDLKDKGNKRPSFPCASHLLSGDWMISKANDTRSHTSHTHLVNRFSLSKSVFFLSLCKPLYKLCDKREALMKNECTARRTQSIETERAYQLHKCVYPALFFILLQTSGAVLGCVGILVSICPCLLLITAATEISSVLVGKFVDVIIYPNGNIIQWKLCWNNKWVYKHFFFPLNSRYIFMLRLPRASFAPPPPPLMKRYLVSMKSLRARSTRVKWRASGKKHCFNEMWQNCFIMYKYSHHFLLQQEVKT